MAAEPEAILRIPTREELLQLPEDTPCPCGSGSTFASCCWKIRSVNWCLPDRSEGGYLSYSDIHNTTTIDLETLRRELTTFEPRNLAGNLAKIAAVLANEYRSLSVGVELKLLQFFFEPTLFKRVRFWILTGARAKVFHRLFVLEALRHLLSQPHGAIHEGATVPHRHDLGELFLKFNDVPEPRYLEISHLAEDDTRRNAAVRATRWRYAFFYMGGDLGSAIGRSWAIHGEGLAQVSRKFNGKTFPFTARFQDAFGFSVQEVLALGFAIAGRYMQSPHVLMNQRDAFVLTPEYYHTLGSKRMRHLVPIMFRYLGRTWEEHCELMKAEVRKDPGNFLQVFSLYDYPMMSLDGSGYFPLDKDFLEAAVTDGPFWKLGATLNKNVDYPQMRDTFGHAFEWYVSALFEAHAVHEGRRLVWMDWDGTLPKVHGHRCVDAIVHDGDTLFFIEATTSSVPPQVSISCEWGDIERQLVKIWFSSDRRTGRGKLKQIAGAISAFTSGALLLEGLSQASLRNLVPVLLTWRAMPQHPHLRQRYRELCIEHGLPAAFADNLVILDIEDLENLLATLDGVRGWAEAFKEMTTQDGGRGLMTDYMATHGLDRNRPARLQAWVEQATQHFHHLLFPSD